MHTYILTHTRTQNCGVERLFPVQSELIPFILQHTQSICGRGMDVCVCSPTGTGKTLAYVIPIVQVGTIQ